MNKTIEQIKVGIALREETLAILREQYDAADANNVIEQVRLQRVIKDLVEEVEQMERFLKIIEGKQE